MIEIPSTSRSRPRDRGAVALEFALVLPILLILSMGIIEFGRAYNAVISLQGAAREGARVLALANLDPSGPAKARTAVTNATVFSIDTIKTFPCSPTVDQAKVLLGETIFIGIPFLPKWPVNLKGDAAMRCGL